MSDPSRTRIFSRLNSAEQCPTVLSAGIKDVCSMRPDKEEKMIRLKTLMEAMRTEVHVAGSGNWVELLMKILKNRELKDLLYAPGTDIGAMLEACWNGNDTSLPKLVPFNQDVEEFKSRLFEVDASITSTAGAIAYIGAIILWPDEKEPRTMSLVPSVHIAVLKAKKIYYDLSEVMHTECWSEKMPTNAVLISGPSKTADIELTLAFGVHGPKELILLVIED